MTPPSAAVSGVKAWCLARRPRTLPAAVGPVLVGTAAAAADGAFMAGPALAALSGALARPIATAEGILEPAEVDRSGSVLRDVDAAGGSVGNNGPHPVHHDGQRVVELGGQLGGGRRLRGGAV